MGAYVESGCDAYQAVRSVETAKNEIVEKLDLIKESILTKNKRFTITQGTVLSVYVKGNFIWWEPVEDAASYQIVIFIANKVTHETQKIGTIEKDRNCLYQNFSDLPTFDNSDELYFRVEVIAEGRDGTVIDKVDISL